MGSRLICGVLLLLLARGSLGACSPIGVLLATQGRGDKAAITATKADVLSGERPAAENQLSMLVRVENRLAAVALLKPQLMICSEDEVQAEAVAGAGGLGYIALYSGLLKIIGADENVAAFVMGHEIGHLIRGHSRKQAVANEVAAEAGAAAGPEYERESGRVGAGVLFERQLTAALAMKFSREQESEADETGYQMMVQAGFDPAGAVKAIKLMIAYTAEGNRPSGYLDDHPGLGVRLAALERLAAVDINRRKWIAAAQEQAEANDRFSAIADDLVASKKEKALASHVADWLRQMPESGVAWYYKGVQLQMSGSSKGAALDAFEKAVTYDPQFTEAWVSLCVALYQEGYKLESANCSRNIKFRNSLDKFDSETEPPVLFVGGFSALPPPFYIGRARDGSRIITNDKGVLKGRGLPLTPMPPDWEPLPH